MIPPCYQHADVLTVTPSDGQRIGFGLLMPDGTKVRYSIPLDDARWMAEYLIQYRMNAQLQSAISSGRPDGPPRSATACAATES